MMVLVMVDLMVACVVVLTAKYMMVALKVESTGYKLVASMFEPKELPSDYWLKFVASKVVSTG